VIGRNQPPINHLQSASLELDESAEIISYEEYHPYGTTSYQAMNAAIKAVAKRYRYTGKERDEESGLYYHGARYYIPWLARWSASDPLESKYAGWSPYNYVKCNPIMDTDNTGMGGDKDLEHNQQYQRGVIHYDYAEYKGWEAPETHAEVSRNFKVGNYDVTPYYKDSERGDKGAIPLFYIASKLVKQRSEFYDEHGKNSVENFTRVDFLIMPWGLNEFRKNVGGDNGYEAQADFMRTSWGVLYRNILPDYLQVLDNDIKGAMWTNVKGMLRDPIFWATAAAGVATLRAPIKVELMGGTEPLLNRGTINYDIHAKIGIADDVANFSKHFSPQSISEITVNNPRATFLNEISSSLKSGATVTVRGTISNKFFNSIWENKASGLENYLIIEKIKDVPNLDYKQTSGQPIKGKINQITLLRK